MELIAAVKVMELVERVMVELMVVVEEVMEQVEAVIMELMVVVEVVKVVYHFPD